MRMGILIVVFAMQAPSIVPHDILDSLTKLQQAAITEHRAARITSQTFTNTMYVTTGCVRAISSAMNSPMPGALYQEYQSCVSNIRNTHQGMNLSEDKISKLGAVFTSTESILGRTTIK